MNGDTGLRVSRGITVDVTAHASGVQPELHSCDHGVRRLTIALRQIGWLDQKGRVWTGEIPPAGFDGGSLTPLLVNPGCD